MMPGRRFQLGRITHYERRVVANKGLQSQERRCKGGIEGVGETGDIMARGGGSRESLRSSMS